MATTTWDALLPDILPMVRNVPKQAAISAIRSAAKDFCERSLIWQETLDTLVFPEGVVTADMEVPAGAIITKIVSFKLEGTEQIPDLQYTADDAAVTLVSVPQRSVSGVVIVALRPTLSATGLPEKLMEAWGDAIAEGAKAVLKSMAGTEWFDAAGAQVTNELFEQAIARAKRYTLVGITPRNLQVRPRSLW